MSNNTEHCARFARCPVRVNKIIGEAEGILSFELVAPNGLQLPPFSAGAHIHVHIDDELTRQYSLCNDPSETHRYVIAVLNEKESRGGSKAMHESVNEGQLIIISGPDNHFALAGREAKTHLLLAGGIGVTPMMAMIEELERAGSPYRLHYCTRSPEVTAFRERLKRYVEAERVVLHHDAGEPGKGLDIPSLVTDYKVGTHVYACGPPGFMEAFNSSVAAWPPHAVHQEYFTARELSEEEKAWDAKAFNVKLISTGKVIEVAAGKSIVDALRDGGIYVDTDCEAGYCGTCITRFVEGEPVHRDMVLDESDREQYVMVCCARAKSDTLVLDL